MSETTDCTTISYRLTPAILFQGHWALHGRRIALTLLTIAALSLLLLHSVWGSESFAAAAIILAIVWLLLLVVYFLAPWLKLRSWLREPNVADEVQLTCCDEGLIGGNQKVQSKYEWSSFTQYIETSSLIVLRVGKLQMLVIPKSAFGSEEELQRCREIIKRNIA